MEYAPGGDLAKVIRTAQRDLASAQQVRKWAIGVGREAAAAGAANADVGAGAADAGAAAALKEGEAEGEGSSLPVRLLPTSRVHTWLGEVAGALRHIHAMRVLHRDLSPKNVLLAADLRCKVSDFGSSFELTSPEQLATTFVGTPYYMAPELLDGRSYSYAADVWALGVIGFELLALRRPFVAKRMEDLKASVLASDFSSISADHQPGRTAAQALAASGHPPVLTELVSPTTMLHPDPTQRMTLEQMLLRLESVPASQPTTAAAAAASCSSRDAPRETLSPSPPLSGMPSCPPSPGLPSPEPPSPLNVKVKVGLGVDDWPPHKSYPTPHARRPPPPAARRRPPPAARPPSTRLGGGRALPPVEGSLDSSPVVEHPHHPSMPEERFERFRAAGAAWPAAAAAATDAAVPFESPAKVQVPAAAQQALQARGPTLPLFTAHMHTHMRRGTSAPAVDAQVPVVAAVVEAGEEEAAVEATVPATAGASTAGASMSTGTGSFAIDPGAGAGADADAADADAARPGSSSEELTPSTVGVPTPPADQAAQCRPTLTPPRPRHLLIARGGHVHRRTTSDGAVDGHRSSDALGRRVSQQRTFAPVPLWQPEDRLLAAVTGAGQVWVPGGHHVSVPGAPAAAAAAEVAAAAVPAVAAGCGSGLLPGEDGGGPHSD